VARSWTVARIVARLFNPSDHHLPLLSAVEAGAVVVQPEEAAALILPAGEPRRAGCLSVRLTLPERTLPKGWYFSLPATAPAALSTVLVLPRLSARRK